MESTKNLIWLVLGLPLLGSLLLGLLGRKLPKALAGAIGTASVAGAFVFGIILFKDLSGLDEAGPRVARILTLRSRGLSNFIAACLGGAGHRFNRVEAARDLA